MVLTRAFMVFVLILAIVAVGGVGFWGIQANLRADRLAAQARAAEASAMKTAGAIVAERVKADAAVERLEGLQAELSRLGKQVAGLHVTSGATWTGERCTFDLPGPAPPAGQSTPPASLPTPTAGGVSFSPRTMTIEPRGVEAVVEGEAGAQALIGHVDLWQVDPLPERLLGRPKFRADVSKYFVVGQPKTAPAPSSLGWGFGGHAELGTSSARIGAAVSPRLRPIFRGRAFHEQVWVAGVEQEWGLQRGLYLGTVQMIRWGK